MSAKIDDPAFPDDDVVGTLDDVGDEVRHKEALREAGALQTAIFNSVNFSSIATDANGVIQIFNVGAERMLGYTAAEVVNKITPADISDPQEVITRAETLSVELGTPITPGFEALVFKASRGIEDIYELTYFRKDGSRFPAVVSVTALRDAQDAIIGYLLIGTDNTARKQAEEALLKAGALQNAIFNSANFSSIATDAKGVIQIFNVGAERMLGYTAAEVMNRITPADISDPQEVIARAKALSVELGTPITPGFEALVFKASRGIEDIYELTYIRQDGSRFPAVVSVTALRDAQDAIIGYLLIGTDNTARKQVEEERKKLDQRLRDQQFYTRSLIESNIDALMTTDPSGIITDVNKQMEALTGCTRDELIGAPFKNYFTDPERAEAAINLVLSEKKVTNYELTARARGGKHTVVSYNATTFYDRDRTLQGVFAAARDVTERNRLDQVLQEKNVELESAKSLAEQANLAKSDFLSSMSHELRTPLNAILGFAQLMESDSQPPTPSQKESIAQILDAGWHLLNLINEILDLAVIESGKVSLSRESVSLDEVMLECRAMMEPQAQRCGIRLLFPQFDNPCFVSSDRTRLKQILINLLSNGIKYNQVRGTVVVDYTVSAPDRIRISIADTGAGLPPEKVAQLFQPFNRLGQEAGGEEGTGIGLVVTKRLVELMGGAIGVHSTVGAGSVFWIELISAAAPQFAVEEGEAAAFAAAQVSHGARLRTLLCVEDNPANLKLVEGLIARCPDLRLLTAVNGILGIELARASQPEMILMDVNLPDIGGIEAMTILRDDPLTAHIPIVALSANAMPGDIKKGLDAGFFRYLTKPIKVNEFMDTLHMVLEVADHRTAKEGRSFPAPVNGQMPAMDGSTLAVSPDLPRVPTARTTKLRILLAEDHPVNQEVARLMLQRLGHHVVVAADGRAALAALEQSGRGAFDLVLMDLQMPVMGGLEATAAIRDAERASGTHVPIVALTAHDMRSGDRERYLDAGLDGYVTKPIDSVELARIIDQLVPRVAPQATISAAAVAAGRPAFDEQFVRARLGDTRLFKKMVRLFLEDCPGRMRAMRRAIAAGDGEALREPAHALQGAAAHFAAASVVEAARQLERQGKNRDLSLSLETYGVLTREMQRLRRALRRASVRRRTTARRQGQRKQGL
ncbi:MAG: PAS domain S-box protein [Gemmatimonadaceae bacterium]|nr:PAS domain S-box protein [Gemmatimonadaceae bacterium]